MQDWSHSQQVRDLISVFSEARPFLGIYSDMAEVSTCQTKDWSSAHQQADLISLFLEMEAPPSSISSGPAGPDGFADCPSCDMQDWSHSQQVRDLISVFSEARPFLGIYSDMAEVSTCQTKDWSSAHQQADLISLFLMGPYNANKAKAEKETFQFRAAETEDWKDFGVDCVASLEALEKLQLGTKHSNPLDAETVWALRAVLRRPRVVARLTSLNLGGNSIGDAGATALSGGLAGCTALQIPGNSIGDAGATALFGSLAGCTALQTLYLQDNFISDAGAAALFHCLAGCTALQYLDLGGNRISDAGIAEAQRVLSRVRNLESPIIRVAEAVFR